MGGQVIVKAFTALAIFLFIMIFRCPDLNIFRRYDVNINILREAVNDGMVLKHSQEASIRFLDRLVRPYQQEGKMEIMPTAVTYSMAV